MKVVFFGTPVFSAEILKDLIGKGVDVKAVVTQPDKEQGRHLHPQPSAVKQVAQKLLPNVSLFQPQKVRDPAFIESLKKLSIDFYIVVAFGQIFPKSLLDIPPHGCINVHTSLLPKYRGAAPIQRAIIEGEEETGVCIMYMVEACDAGDIIALKKVPILSKDTTKELTLRLCDAAKDTLYPALNDILHQKSRAFQQNPEEVSYAKKVTVQTAQIDWSLSSNQVYNLYRGVSPKPGAWCWIQIRGKRQRLKIKEMSLSPMTGKSCGSILHYDSKGIVVSCQSGAVALTVLQLEGKKALSAEDFVKGYLEKDVSFCPVEAFK